jgi:hypothetical protein
MSGYYKSGYWRGRLGGLDWIGLVRDQLRALVNVAVNLQIP